MGGGGNHLWQRRFWCLDCQDNGKNLGKIAFLRKTGLGNLDKFFSFEKACNHFKRPLFRSIKFFFRHGNFQLQKKSSGATLVENALVVALVIIAAVGGLSYIGLAVQDRLDILAGVTNSGNEANQKAKTAWDTFFEGLQSILDDGDGIENLLKEGKDLKKILGEKFDVLFEDLAKNVDLDQAWPEEWTRISCYESAIHVKYAKEPPNAPQTHPSEFPPSNEYDEYMTQIEEAYNNNETAFDKVAALVMIKLAIEAEPDDSPLFYEYHTTDSNGNEYYIGREFSILGSYLDCYIYKAYHPEWEISDPEPYPPTTVK
ncbi:MAG: hypothetical protein LBC04_01970 [Holosporaceae bacterium]|jgi:Flp pilus assembly pilin Flp|nr:hypothetical protein [Holosporaceae bacterium]